MARPVKRRYVCNTPEYASFSPDNINRDDAVILSVDDYEVFRLLDYEQITQRECAFQMKVARTTVTDIYNQARQKLADALVNGKRLIIDGGSYDLCERRNNCVGFRECFEAKYQYGTEDRKED